MLRNRAIKHPKLLTALLLGGALSVTGSAWAQEPAPLRGTEIPMECFDPATGALLLTEENYYLCVPFVAGLTTNDPARTNDGLGNNAFGQAPSGTPGVGQPGLPGQPGGTPPGQGGTPPGQGGTPPGEGENGEGGGFPGVGIGVGGTPPAGGTPPGTPGGFPGNADGGFPGTGPGDRGNSANAGISGNSSANAGISGDSAPGNSGNAGPSGNAGGNAGGRGR